MKQSPTLYLILLFSISVVLSCSSTGEVSSTARDGLTYETAIIAKSIGFEYDWIRKNYPGSQPRQQMLAQYKKKPYDIITIVTPSGESKDIYFDISDFFGKGF